MTPDLVKAEPKTLRYGLLHVPAKLTTGGRRRRPRIPPNWPWAKAIVSAFEGSPRSRHPADTHPIINHAENEPPYNGRGSCRRCGGSRPDRVPANKGHLGQVDQEPEATALIWRTGTKMHAARRFPTSAEPLRGVGTVRATVA